MNTDLSLKLGTTDDDQKLNQLLRSIQISRNPRLLGGYTCSLSTDKKYRRIKEKKDMHVNHLQFKSAFKKFMVNPESSPNRQNQNKSTISDYQDEFQPFVKERDHLGRMIGPSVLLKSSQSDILNSENTRAQSEMNNYESSKNDDSLILLSGDILLDSQPHRA